MPAPIIMYPPPQSNAVNPAADIGTIGHPAPDGMLIDIDGDPCHSEHPGCHPKGALIAGLVWPDHAARTDPVPASPAAGMQDLTARRAAVQARERELYAVIAQTPDSDPAHAAAETGLRQCWAEDLALSKEQAPILERERAQAEANLNAHSY